MQGWVQWNSTVGEHILERVAIKWEISQDLAKASFIASWSESSHHQTRSSELLGYL